MSYALAQDLLDQFNGHSAHDILDLCLNQVFEQGEIAMVSSFGTEASVLLHLVASVKPETPVIFTNTHKLFPETFDYMQTLQSKLGLQNIVMTGPDLAEVHAEDPDDDLWARDNNACCDLRKTRPLARALKPYKAWISGRKGFHGGNRSGMDVVEFAKGKIKINPLAYWNYQDLTAYMEENNLPEHPLKSQGYFSVGCTPTACTAKGGTADNPRAGRWQNQEKTECGIHYNI